MWEIQALYENKVITKTLTDGCLVPEWQRTTPHTQAMTRLVEMYG